MEKALSNNNNNNNLTQEKTMNIAIILAGGSGTRLGGERPKQFLSIAGKMVIEHTIEAFHRNSRIDEIAIVCRNDFLLEMHDMVNRNNYTKVKHILSGGKERYHSSLAALKVYKDSNDLLLFHDCVRPLVTDKIINDCLDALQTYDAVEAAVPATDTIVEVDSEGRICRIPKRSSLRNVQTPQGFRQGVIAEAFRRALSDPAFFPTDDCSVVFAYMPESSIAVVAGDTNNIKITYKEDLAFAERILSTRKQ